MKTARYPYLVNKAFFNILMASLLSTIAMQLATSIGVIVAGNFVSPDAVSVINLTMPIISFVNAAYILFGMGASYRISRLLGNNDYDSVKRVFSCSVVAVVTLAMLFTVLLLVFHQDIARMLTSDARLSVMQTEYLSVFAFQPLFFMPALHFGACVKSIGNSRLIPKATLAGMVLQIVTAYTSVVFFGMGVKGIALAACVGFAAQNAIYLFKGIWPSELLNGFTFHFKMGPEIKKNMKHSFPLFLSLFLMGSMLFAINHIVASTLGTDGLNIASVCMQLMLLSIMLMAGINSATMPIGNMMMGEGDYDGVRMLNTTVTKVVAVIFATVLILILCFPAAVLQLFGLDDTSIENGGSGAIRIFALLIPLQSYSMLRMTRLMILSYTKLASLSATLRVVLMLAVVALIAHIAPKHLWWGFPLSALMNETVIGFLSYRIHRRTPGTSPLTLIPKDSASTIWSSSLPYDLQSLSVILGEIERFLSKSHADDRTIKKIMLTTEELACNIIKFAQKGKVNQRFDILIRAMDDKFIVSLKDDGKPFNPIKKDGYGILETEDYTDLLNVNIGLRIVNNIGLHLEYRYMYGQNIVTILNFRK